MKANTIISWLTAILVTFLAAAAFVLSYDVLRQVAQQNSVNPTLACLWPLTLDAVMIAASLAVLRGNLNKERTAYPWLLVGAFTILSIVFNVEHAGASWLARGVYALPPAVCFLAFELLMAQVKATVQRQGVVAGIAGLEAEAAEKRQAVAALTADLDALTGRRDILRQEIAALRQEKRQAIPAVGDATRQQAAAILAERCDISGAELGRLLGRSASLGRQLKRELLPVGGNGSSGSA